MVYRFYNACNGVSQVSHPHLAPMYTTCVLHVAPKWRYAPVYTTCVLHVAPQWRYALHPLP